MGRIRQTTAAVLFHLGRSADRVARATSYLAAGTRRMADLQADLRRSWDRFYTDHPSHDSTLLRWEAEIVDTFVRPGFDVLLVGCGSGRDLVPLVEHGCRVTGIDPSEAAITIAQRLLQMRGRSALLLTGFFEDLSIAGRFETVIFSYYAYASIPMSGRRRAALAKASALLKSDGHVIVSHAAGGTRPGAVLGQLGRIAGALSRSDWRIEPEISCGPIDRTSHRLPTPTSSRTESSKPKLAPRSCAPFLAASSTARSSQCLHEGDVSDLG
jgi:SAM-dependent methyltransferase